MSGGLENVTMLVPTRERHGYLKALLDMYAGSGLKIRVADTSSRPFDRITDYPDVDYTHFDTIAFPDKLRFLAEGAKTPYVVLRAENRHVTLDGIRDCARALDADPSCTLAHGAHFWARKKAGKIEYWPCYHEDNKRGLMHDSPEERLKAAFDPMVSLYYAVEHRENLLDVTSYAEGIDNLNAFEMLLTAVKAINGRCARVPRLFCLVQERKSAAKGAAMYENFRHIVHEKRHAEQYERLISAIASHLTKKSGTPEDKARKLADTCMQRVVEDSCVKRKRTFGEKWADKLRKYGRALRPGHFVAYPEVPAALRTLEGDPETELQQLLNLADRGYRQGW